MEQTYKQLAKITTLKPEQIANYRRQLQGQPQSHIQSFLISVLSKENIQNQAEITSKFINYMSDKRHCKLSNQLLANSSMIKFMACSDHKVYHFDNQSRAYCLYGKAVSVMRRKSKQVQNQRNQLSSQIQNTIFQLNSQGTLVIPKNESHQIDDILLNFSLPDDLTDPIFLSNEVFTPFVPQPYALVMIISIPLPRPDLLINFLKGTLLHFLVEQANLLNKVIFRQVFYKNSLIKGIYFIQQGQVESTGGRVVARGWITNGKCKSQGYGWKFKPLPFIKSIVKNQHVWKQFVNDLNLNKQYPFRISYILGLQDDQESYDIPEKNRKKPLRLPRIGHNSFDYGKLTEMEKVKHYDDRINEICQFKQKLYLKKASQSYNRNTLAKLGEDEMEQMKILAKNKSINKQLNRYGSKNLNMSSSSENILIMSVLKKLEGLTEPTRYEQDETKQKRDKIKISPAKLFEKSRVMKKKRYNQ